LKDLRPQQSHFFTDRATTSPLDRARAPGHDSPTFGPWRYSCSWAILPSSVRPVLKIQSVPLFFMLWYPFPSARFPPRFLMRVDILFYVASGSLRTSFDLPAFFSCVRIRSHIVFSHSQFSLVFFFFGCLLRSGVRTGSRREKETPAADTSRDCRTTVPFYRSPFPPPLSTFFAARGASPIFFYNLLVWFAVVFCWFCRTRGDTNLISLLNYTNAHPDRMWV